MGTSFSAAEIMKAVADALSGKGIVAVNAILDDWEVRFPDAKAFLETLRALAHTAAAAESLAVSIPAGLQDALKTIREGHGPVDTSGGATL
jgi:hypothetical protein